MDSQGITRPVEVDIRLGSSPSSTATVADLQKALATQLANIEKKTGKSIAELTSRVEASGLRKHGEIRDMLKRDLGLGHGDANSIAHVALDTAASRVASLSRGDDGTTELDRLYVGPKAGLRPLHDAVMARVAKFGEFEVAPKKTYLSLRRNKQFLMIGPATSTQLEIGLNLKNAPVDARLVTVKQPAMCSMKVRLAGLSEVDARLVAWMRQAYDQAG